MVAALVMPAAACALGSFASHRSRARCLSPAASIPHRAAATVTTHVAVIGWLGARERHLKKVASVWEKEPQPLVLSSQQILCFQPSVLGLLMSSVRRRELMQFSEALAVHLERTPAHSAAHSRLRIHALSNNGFFFLAGVLYETNSAVRRGELPSENAAARLARALDNLEALTLVVDSAPSRIDADIAARGMLSAVLGEPAKGVETRHDALYNTLYGTLGTLLRTVSATERLREVQQDVWEDELTLQRKFSMLLLHSRSDSLIPPEDVKAHEKKMRSLIGSGAVERQEWEDGGEHVELYRNHPDRYRNALEDFIRRHDPPPPPR